MLLMVQPKLKFADYTTRKWLNTPRLGEGGKQFKSYYCHTKTLTTNKIEIKKTGAIRAHKHPPISKPLVYA